MTEPSRGSARLREMSPEVLHKAINQAKESYRIERWWKYGQPAIDRITATVDVTNVASAGSIIGSLIALQSPQRQVGVVVFPYGIPVVDGVRLELSLDEAAV